MNKDIEVNKVENGMNIKFEVYVKTLHQKIKIAECPKCGDLFDSRFPALSRKDNRTKICPECGTIEALGDWCNFINKNNKVKTETLNN